MADTLYKVKVDVYADISEFKKQFANIGKERKKFDISAAKMSDTAVKQQKAVFKAAKDHAKAQKTVGSAQIKDQKVYVDLLKAQNKELKEQVKLLNQTAKAGSKSAKSAINKNDLSRVRKNKLNVEDSHTKAGRRQGPTSNLMQGVMMALGGQILNAVTAVLTMPFQAITEQVGAYRNYRLASSKLAGYGGGGITAAGANAFRKDIINLGYSPEESIGLLASTARATGTSAAARTNAEFSRLLGVDASSLMGSLAQAGTDMRSQQAAQRAMVKAVAAGVASGLEKGRLPEYLEGLQSLLSGAGSRAAGTVDPQQYEQLLATLGRSGMAGFRGARGAAVAAALDQGFRNPGGGEEGQALVMASLGFGSPGGRTSWYNARKMMQQGLSQDGSSRFRNLMAQVDRATQSEQESNVVLGEMFGLSLDQIEGVRKAFSSKSDSELDQMLKDITATEKDVLVDIRNILKSAFLEQNRHQARIANDQVDAGAQLNESVQAMQDILHEFIHQALPAVKDVLTEVSDAMKRLAPVLETTASTMNQVVDWITDNVPGFTRSRARTESATRTTTEELTRVGRPLNEEEEAELLRRTKSALTSRLASLPRYGGNAQWAEMTSQSDTNRTALAEARSIVQGLLDSPALKDSSLGELGTATDSARVQSDRELIAMLTRLALNQPSFSRTVGNGFDGRADTRREIQMILTYLAGINAVLPPSFRAVIQNSGGSRP